MPQIGKSRTQEIVDTVYHQLPEVFEQHRMPGSWDRDWIVAPLGDPEAPATQNAPESWWLGDDTGASLAPSGNPQGRYPWVPVMEGRSPGGPLAHDWSSEFVPPPDALAFYLPFHYYYYPRHWGIYVTADGERWLARYLAEKSEGALHVWEAGIASRVFLYGHEAYHHSVESFGTRLETTHRRPLYKTGMESLYQSTVGTDACVEEGLANVYGRDKAVAVCRTKLHWPAAKIQALKSALAIYFQNSGPGYRMAVQYLLKNKFIAAESGFAEQNQRRAVSPMPELAPAIWGAFPHALGPIANIRSKVKYIVHRDSPWRFRVEQLRMAAGA